MNITQNFKQSWQIIKQNKLFSSIYIVGTAIAVLMVMVIAVVWISKTADMYPETNRSRMMSIKGIVQEIKGNQNYMSSSGQSHKFVEDFVRSSEMVECVTEVIIDDDPRGLRLYGDDVKHSVRPLNTDHYFWRVFEFDFLAGMTYTEEEVASRITKAVISEWVAEQFFGGAENAIGKHFTLDFVDFAVCGVVRDVPAVMSLSYADVWLPVTTYQVDDEYGSGYLGSEYSYILAHSSKDFAKIKKEVEEKVAAFNNSSEKYTINLVDQPERVAAGFLRVWSNEAPDIKGYIIKMFLIVLTLLLVPAVNLAGMISSRMAKRMEELGIRKAFGAPKMSIFMQIMNENLLLTLLGGALGLVLCYLFIAVGGNAILGLIVPETIASAGHGSFSLGMMLNPWIFLIAIGSCLILNVLAALIPAIYSLKHNIVDSLNVKK